MFEAITDFLWCWVFGYIGFLSLATYFIPFLFHSFVYRPRDLKKAYNAEWALVTGASSGIGKALAIKLAEQKINVVLVALDDDLLRETFEDLQKQYPDLTFRKVGVDLSRDGYMDQITNATNDLKINLLFNNAGYILGGFFPWLDEQKILGNYECNATSAIKITHHFVGKMIEREQKGFVSFTSSPAQYFPGSFFTMYGATKAFLSSFASSLAGELRGFGIDVTVYHPSPIDSRFYGNADGSKMLLFFKRFAADPAQMANVIFCSAGRTVVRDQGAITAIFKVLLKVIDANLIFGLSAMFSKYTGEFKTYTDKNKYKKNQ